MKKVSNKSLIVCVVLIVVTLMAAIIAHFSSFDRDMDRATKYFCSDVNMQSSDPGKIASIANDFVSLKGVKYLIESTSHKNVTNKESAVFILLLLRDDLDNIYGDDDFKSEVKLLLSAVDLEGMKQEIAKTGHTPFIRDAFNLHWADKGK